MFKTTILVLCSFTAATAQSEVTLKADTPFVSVPVSHDAVLECCYSPSVRAMKATLTWVKSFKAGGKVRGPFPVNVSSENVTVGERVTVLLQCETLTLKSVQMSDTGLYQCLFNATQIFSYGTYLLVYKPLQKTIDVSESTKNKILIAEGFLLLLCMVLPSANLILKSKKLKQLEKQKAAKEEENIYQGLNVDECCTTYDQIERPQGQGPYEDVYNIMEEEEDIQLEKP